MNELFFFLLFSTRLRKSGSRTWQPQIELYGANGTTSVYHRTSSFDGKIMHGVRVHMGWAQEGLRLCCR